MKRELDLPDPDATAALAADLAGCRPAWAVVYLEGGLGAGKSTLARALLRALGVKGAVRSPTYTLVERYPIPGGEAAHLDLYRLASAAELDFLGLDELAADATLWLVEWPERGKGLLPPADLRIQLAVHGKGRRAKLVPGTQSGEAWLGRLAELRQGGGQGVPGIS
ncbi:tRNA (adenosine(37)-N6)-threonylcarbamoyltransferase complex ATPase subunit type 1 TsaE [Arenimonas fontis]|uniref:tRNA threonylcarbamoyladenosine biosynthesis protein TsaE n=1 Tax=Arenimonas fontis TaxID=2608255 RepID=A0A5B2ZET6_9GAMM|nr:tRNA (adenosine(37)-N6)-threonylcarbamoyltransferase complex ATPase subunit type 1 TsaE [Arenimonas fontis]KAA2285561.1 tRNA (adenosine(37)-N6)-threonylcarbamoyltransferase complex ATPase subunit type 1 TsaE [Arenimonas fontis]